MTQFDLLKSNIAITVPKFTLLKKHSEWFEGEFNDPYLLSMAVDARGAANPEISFNFMPFPKIAAGGTVQMLGDGHLVYGPGNPGDFVAVSILVMESDRDIRGLGDEVSRFLQTKGVDLGLKAVMLANPRAAPVVAIMKELTQWLAGRLKENGDDELFRMEGSFLRDSEVPYHVNRQYQTGNDYIEISEKVVPLAAGNGQGTSPRLLSL